MVHVVTITGCDLCFDLNRVSSVPTSKCILDLTSRQVQLALINVSNAFHLM